MWFRQWAYGALPELLEARPLPRTSSTAATPKSGPGVLESFQAGTLRLQDYDSHQVQEASRHGDVDDVRGPELVDSINLDSFQQVGIDSVSRRRLPAVKQAQGGKPHLPTWLANALGAAVSPAPTMVCLSTNSTLTPSLAALQSS